MHALSLANESSLGPDEITYTVIKHTHPSLKQILQLYNEILLQRTFPSSWQLSIIIPIKRKLKNLVVVKITNP